MTAVGALRAAPPASASPNNRHSNSNSNSNSHSSNDNDSTSTSNNSNYSSNDNINNTHRVQQLRARDRGGDEAAAVQGPEPRRLRGQMTWK